MPDDLQPSVGLLLGEYCWHCESSMSKPKGPAVPDLLNHYRLKSVGLKVATEVAFV